jgi:hypothetical protein
LFQGIRLEKSELEVDELLVVTAEEDAGDEE